MAFHYLHCSPRAVHWGFLDASLPDVLSIDSGDVVRIDTVSSGESRLPEERARFEVLPDHLEVIRTCVPRLGPHILTGPVGVHGAEPGDVLHVKILSVELRQNWAWNEISSGSGLLAELELDPEMITLPIDREEGLVHLPWGRVVSAAPFFGVMAVKPPKQAGAVTSLIPGVFGGNLDIRWLRPGAEICFPVHHPGAGFSVGDGHAIQGDGEVNGTAAETALTGEFHCVLEKNASHLPFPYAVLPGRVMTLAVDESLDKAAELALRQAVELLGLRYGLNSRTAYRHCSLLGHLGVSQVVNVKRGVHCLVDVEGLS
jgi:acetamidase/formamidase